MAFDLTPESKKKIIEERLQQFASEKFQHELNLMTATAIGDTVFEQNSTNAIAQLDAAIAVHEKQLDVLQ